MNLNKYYFNVFKNLLKIDLQLLSETFFDKMINLGVWVICTIVVMGYIMPLLGLTSDYGVFQLAGLVASAGLFEVFPSVMNLVVDYDGDKLILYQLTLPVPSWLIFIKIICNYAINAIMLGLIVLPMGKLMLWNQFDLSKIAIIPFIVTFIMTGIFFGVFTLFVSSLVKNMATIENVWMRFLFPLWFMGGFQFSWLVLYKLVPNLAYVNLLNPITYIMEGMRATLLGQEGYINYLYCLAVIFIFTVIFGYTAIVRLKKRLDYV